MTSGLELDGCGPQEARRSSLRLKEGLTICRGGSAGRRRDFAGHASSVTTVVGFSHFPGRPPIDDEPNAHEAVPPPLGASTPPSTLNALNEVFAAVSAGLVRHALTRAEHVLNSSWDEPAFADSPRRHTRILLRAPPRRPRRPFAVPRTSTRHRHAPALSRGRDGQVRRVLAREDVRAPARGAAQVHERVRGLRGGGGGGGCWRGAGDARNAPARAAAAGAAAVFGVADPLSVRRGYADYHLRTFDRPALMSGALESIRRQIPLASLAPPSMSSDDAVADDILLVAHTVNLAPSLESLQKQDYLQRYPLAFPPHNQTLSHEERRTAVHQYFKKKPCLQEPEQKAIALSKKLYHDFKEEPNWRQEQKCPICGKREASILLPCSCRYAAYHLSCFQTWHVSKGVERVVDCPTCRQPTKPVNVGWIEMSSSEKDERDRKKAQAKKEDKKASAKERARNAGRQRAKARRDWERNGGKLFVVALRTENMSSPSTVLYLSGCPPDLDSSIPRLIVLFTSAHALVCSSILSPFVYARIFRRHMLTFCTEHVGPEVAVPAARICR
ncbi:hypothetical protein C8F04DRAFT_1255775 [Mycena alexandri]|uniref:RING-type domain-containing protein n=1 Tax=Mycena alexandri TaxID=1745969 RepID=A0AAD6T2I0_9AGAR|nr:hypothetical protein C8F04DRAFT_1255775 [Mycena alexandri]